MHSKRIFKNHLLAHASTTHQQELAVRRTGFLESQALLRFHTGGVTNPAGRILKKRIIFFFF